MFCPFLMQVSLIPPAIRSHRSRDTNGLQALRNILRSLNKRSSKIDVVAGGGGGKAGIGGGDNPLDFNVNAIYTKWSKWSRCRKKCKQVRKRYCTVPAICGSNVLREERPCRGKRNNRGGVGKRCSRKQNFHIVKRRKLSRATKGMLRYNRAYYSRWSKWSPCSKTCKTTRTRTCKFTLVCGASSVHEEAYCYTDGSLCEQWFMQGKSLSLVEKFRNGKLEDSLGGDTAEVEANNSIDYKNGKERMTKVSQSGQEKTSNKKPLYDLEVIGQCS
jgi:hypothetical protein